MKSARFVFFALWLRSRAIMLGLKKRPETITEIAKRIQAKYHKK